MEEANCGQQTPNCRKNPLFRLTLDVLPQGYFSPTINFSAHSSASECSFNCRAAVPLLCPPQSPQRSSLRCCWKFFGDAAAESHERAERGTSRTAAGGEAAASGRAPRGDGWLVGSWLCCDGLAPRRQGIDFQFLLFLPWARPLEACDPVAQARPPFR